jgi:hypothetical protein
LIIWWSAHRLTWDCTLIDDDVDASGAGLLEEAGLEKGQPIANESTPPRPAKKKASREASSLDDWRRRYAEYRAKRTSKPHVPGVWVVYFSLAALPLFGLGQAEIPPA